MNLQQPHFYDDDAARAYYEGLRWPDGRVCPHCGSIGTEYATKRAGRYRCGVKQCRKDFTTTTGTVMESSKIGLSKWLWTFAMMTSSKKGISSQQVRRSLEVSAKTAWFMCHRVREAMKAGGLLAPLGGPGKVVEADETYWGKVDNPSPLRRDTGAPLQRAARGGYGPANKRAILALVERGGSVRTFHIAEARAATVHQIVRENIDAESRLHTDGSSLYVGVGREFAEHGRVDHSLKEYVRYEEAGPVHNNSCEAYFSVLKKGLSGVYQHCQERNLARYLVEFEFRHNTRTRLGVDDKTRADIALRQAEGKRLTWRRSNRAA